MESDVIPLSAGKSIDLTPGDYTVGVIQTSDVVSEPHLLVSGYRIRTPDADPGDMAIVKVTDTDESHFGVDEAEAETVNLESLFRASVETETGLRYRTDDGKWVVSDRGEVETDILSQLPREVERETSLIDIFLPGFDPRAIVPVAIELLVQSEPQSDIAMYTPGTANHWGSKKDIKKEFSAYGISSDMGTVGSAVPLNQLYTLAYISENQIKEYDEGSMSSRLVLTKQLDEFPDSWRPEFLIVNSTSRTREGYREKLDRFRGLNGDTTIVEVWSTFPKRDDGDFSEYGPPTDFSGTCLSFREGAIEDIKSRYEHDVGWSTSESVRDHRADEKEGDRKEHVPPTTSDLVGYINRSKEDLTVSAVGGSELRELFEKVRSISDALEDEGFREESRMVFKAQMFFEQLPIPTQLYDDIIQERAIDGEVYLPKTSKEYIDELDSHDSSGAGSLLSAVKRLEKIRHELKEGNPLFDSLVEHVVDSVEENRNTLIFARGSKMEEILQEALEDRSEIDDGGFGDLVSIVSPDSARDIEPHDELVFAGSQFPGYACFYLHPRVKQTHILTCTDWSAEMVRRHIDDAVKSLNQTFPLNEKTVERSGYSGPDDPQENGQSEDEVDIPKDLQQEDLDRLKEIVELAPTKNGELAESWGYESGSEVYQYLSSSLGEYYTRNEDNLIVPKEEGKEIVESLESE